MLRPLTLSFNSLRIIELIGPQDDATGRHLASRLSAQNAPYQVSVHRLESNDDLLPALSAIAFECRTTSLRPILHFDTHASPQGLGRPDAVPIPWEALRHALTDINLATKINLLITMGACYGAYAADLVRPMATTPVWGVVGPTEQVFESEVRSGFEAFFSVLHSTQSLDAASAALAARSVSIPESWTVLGAEQLFALAFGQYLALHAGPGGRRRLELTLLKDLRRKGSITRRGLRAKIRRSMLSERRRQYATMKSTFFALDRFPDNAARFPLEIEDALELYGAFLATRSDGAV